MPMPKSDAPLSEWSTYLGELVEEAKEASGADDRPQMTRVQERLREYVEQSPWEARVLDRIARSLETDLYIQWLQSRMTSIKTRDAEYVAIKQLIDALTPSASKKKGDK